MTSIFLLLALAVAFAALVSYARHDRFAGPSRRVERHDDLGRTAPRSLAF